MKKNQIKKGMVLIIIALMVSLIFIPIISGDTQKYNFDFFIMDVSQDPFQIGFLSCDLEIIDMTYSRYNDDWKDWEFMVTVRNNGDCTISGDDVQIALFVDGVHKDTSWSYSNLNPYATKYFWV